MRGSRSECFRAINLVYSEERMNTKYFCNSLSKTQKENVPLSSYQKNQEKMSFYQRMVIEYVNPEMMRRKIGGAGNHFSLI
jgi:hypothetical protein